MNEAIRVYSRVTLTSTTSPDAVDKFILYYTSARTLMIEHGLIVDGDIKSEIREL